MPRFLFVHHKKKARSIAVAFGQGAARLGHDFRMEALVPGRSPVLREDEILVMQSVTAGTRALFFDAIQRPAGAIILDNGWLSGERETTLRWCWNGMQAPSGVLPPSERDARRLGWFPLPKPSHRLSGSHRAALLVLSSRQFFDHVELGFTYDEFVQRARSHLEAHGWTVIVRPKPLRNEGTKGNIPPLNKHLSVVGFVASLCSAVHLRALAYGIPSATALPTTVGRATLWNSWPRGQLKRPSQEIVERAVKRIAWAEATYDDLRSGVAIRRMLSVPPEQRKGIIYGSDKRAHTGRRGETASG